MSENEADIEIEKIRNQGHRTARRANRADCQFDRGDSHEKSGRCGRKGADETADIPAMMGN